MESTLKAKYDGTAEQAALFCAMAVNKLRDIAPKANGKVYKGIHTVYSGFNEALTEWAGLKGLDHDARLARIKAIVAMACDSKTVVSFPCRKGAVLMLAEDAKWTASSNKGKKALGAILGIGQEAKADAVRGA